MAWSIKNRVRAMPIAAFAITIAIAIVLPVAARAEIITLECSGEVTGTFTIDLSGGTAATYDDNRTVDLTEVEISESPIAFALDTLIPATETTQSGGSSSRFRIDRQTNKVEQLTYEYANNKITGTSRASGQCKKVATPRKPL
jgi:hypothetical protein